MNITYIPIHKNSEQIRIFFFKQEIYCIKNYEKVAFKSLPLQVHPRADSTHPDKAGTSLHVRSERRDFCPPRFHLRTMGNLGDKTREKASQLNRQESK